MKHDHTFTFTAAVVLAGVVLAFVNPAEAINSTAPVVSTIEHSISVPASTQVMAAVAAPAAATATSPAKHKGDCARSTRPDPRA